MALGANPMIKRKPSPGPIPISAHDLRANYNKMHGAGAAKGQSGHNLRSAYNQSFGAGAAGGVTPTLPAPVAQPPAAAPAPAVEPPVSTPEAPPVDNSAALFPGIRAFEPKNYQGSPLYQMQLDQGTKKLEKIYAARGHSNSGKELEGIGRFVNELGANEAMRAQGVAQQEADRAERMQTRESDRLTGQSRDKWGQITDVLDMMLRQNPMDAATQATRDQAEMVLGQGNTVAGQIKGQTPRVRGGTGAPPPRYNPPTPGGPDMSGYNSTQAKVDAQGNINYGDILTNLLGSFF
jgi:hypothetical protein